MAMIVGCGDPPLHDDVGSRRSAIIGGVEESGRPEVGVIHAGNQSACTGTLIGTRAVLTAAHCVATKTPPYQLIDPVNFYIGGLYGTRYTAASAIVHPGYAGGNNADIAVVLLKEDVTEFSPIQIASSPPVVGEEVVLVGYGRTGEESGSFGTMHRAVNIISSVEAQIFRIEGVGGGTGNICNGDSGGPTFAKRNGREVLIGIHSTKGGVCGQQGNDMRADVFLPWIANQISANAGSFSPTPLPFGATCVDHEDCDSGLCAVDHATGQRFCTTLCNAAQSRCPLSATCYPIGENDSERAICGLPPIQSLAGDTEFEGGCSLARNVSHADAHLRLWPALCLILTLLALRRRRRGGGA
jgi:V8-like Glu-specific endopeptidase